MGYLVQGACQLLNVKDKKPIYDKFDIHTGYSAFFPFRSAFCLFLQGDSMLPPINIRKCPVTIRQLPSRNTAG